MSKNFKLERLLAGETFVTSEKGNSMVPLIKSGQEHRLTPCTWEQAEPGDIVYCKVSRKVLYPSGKIKGHTARVADRQ